MQQWSLAASLNCKFGATEQLNCNQGTYENWFISLPGNAISYAISVAELRYHLLLKGRVDLSNNSKQFTVK